MGRISSGIGLVSGINSQAIIEQLMSLEARPKTMLQQRVAQANQQKLALTDLSTRLTALKLSFTTLKKISTFQAAKAASSNEDILTATVSSGAPQGTYRFQVSRLVSSQQAVSGGFASTATKVGSSKLGITAGDGPLVSNIALTQLNGGAGVRSGSFTITNRLGTVATIDITSATTLDDVVAKINASNIAVNATVVGQGLQINDNSGGTNDLIIAESGGGFAATDLGIVGSVAATTFTGTDINYIGTATKLSDLNDGTGVRHVGGNDIRVTFTDASTVDIDVSSATTVQHLMDTVNTASAGQLQVQINATGDGLRLVNATGPAGNITVSALNSSSTASDLGLLGTGDPINGRTLMGGLNTVLISSLNGGAGLNLGSLTITNRDNNSATIDLSTAKTVQDILDAINGAGISVSASLNSAKTGIQITDNTTGLNNLVIANADANNIATQLGIAGTFDTGYTAVVGANLKRAKLTAGTLTVELGGGEVYSQTLLSQLNGGAGIQRGTFRITDRSGKSGVIDISSAFTLDDVVKKINTSLDISVKASISGDRLVLTDLSGQTASNLIVTDLGDGTTATDLGIASSVAGNTLTGNVINSLGRSTAAALLNDGLGVRTANGSADFRITARDGSTFDITVNGLSTVGAIVDAINNATGGKVTASIPAAGKAIRLTDSSGGGGNLTVAALNSSKAAADLGIEQSVAANQMDSGALLASINTVLLSTLRGGAGLNLGTISITDRSGANAVVDLAGSVTVQDIIDRISNAAGVSVTARLKSSGNGIEIVDDTGGTGNLVISDGSSTSAAELGIAGTFATDTAVVRGANLQRKWVNDNTVLSTYNGGKGVSTGKFKITNSNGVAATIDLTIGTYTTLGDVIREINTKATGVTASINANGDGLLLTDSAGGALRLKVEDVSGRAAADLNIKGTASTTTIDGSFEKTISLSATDTLQTAADAINAPGFAIAATIVNDGSGTTPYRLSLSARNTGRAGRFIFDGGDTALHASNLVEAQDAAVYYGDAGGSQSLLVTSSSNKLSGMVKGLSIDLHSASSAPATVTVSQDIESAVSELDKFVDNFNEMVTKLADLTKFDSKTNTRGILLGDSTAQRVQSQIYSFLQTIVKEAGSYDTLGDMGLRLGRSSNGTPPPLEFDEDKFRTAWTTDPESVRKLFTLYEKGVDGAADKKGLGYLIEEKIDRLINPVDGAITRQSSALDKRTDDFQDRMDQIDKLIAIKRTRLEKQFASMESVLANLQSQQQSLASFSTLPSLISRSSSR